MNRNLIGSSYGKPSIQIAHFVPTEPLVYILYCIICMLMFQDIVFLVPDLCRATPRNLQYKRGRLKCLARCLFLIFLDNFAVVFFNYKTLQNKHNIRTLSGNIKTVRNSFSEWLSDCLAPTQQFYSYIMARPS